MCVSILYLFFSFWLTSLCMTDSNSIHLITNTSISFLFFFLIFFLIFIYLNTILFIYGCVGSSFLCEGFLQLWQVGATLHRGARGLSLLRPLQTRRLSNCGPRAQPLRGMRDPPRPGLEPASPALAGRFSTTAPPGKPPFRFFLWLSNIPLYICATSSLSIHLSMDI